MAETTADKVATANGSGGVETRRADSGGNHGNQAFNEAGSLVSGQTPRSFSLASRGIEDGRDFEDYMKALMCDVVLGGVSSKSAHAAAALGRNLLKAVELKLRYEFDVLGHKVD